MIKTFGLIGESLGHSFSPIIHNKIFEKTKILGNYQLFEMKRQNLGKAIHDFNISNLRGLNVTIPYKIECIKYIDGISKEAEKIGAVNTIKFESGKAIGYNTDYLGIDMTMKKYNVDIKDKNVVVLGYGGASGAVIQYLLDKAAKEIIVAGRNMDKMMAIGKLKDYKLINVRDVLMLKDQDIIINCTPCGMYPNIDECPVEENALSNFSVAFDLIYNPSKTKLLKISEKKGLKAVNGLYMLVGQAISSEEIWNDVKIPQNLTDEIYESIKNELR